MLKLDAHHPWIALRDLAPGQSLWLDHPFFHALWLAGCAASVIFALVATVSFFPSLPFQVRVLRWRWPALGLSVMLAAFCLGVWVANQWVLLSPDNAYDPALLAAVGS